MTSPEIEQRDHLTREEFTERFLLPRTPVVLRSAMRSMGAVDRWDLDFFAAHYGDRRVPVDGAQSGKRMRLREYVEDLRSKAASPSEGGALYMRNLMLFEQFPELRSEFQMPWIAQPNWLQSRWHGDFSGGSWTYWVELFLSGKDSRFPFVHIDPYYTHAWSIQISGRKRFWLWGPTEGQFEQLLAGTLERQDARRITPETKFESHFQARSGHSLVLGPGDLLFLPAGWWHTTETSEESVTLGGNFVERSNWPEFSEYYCKRNPHHTLPQAISRRLSALVAPLLLPR